MSYFKVFLVFPLVSIFVGCGSDSVVDLGPKTKDAIDFSKDKERILDVVRRDELEKRAFGDINKMISDAKNMRSDTQDLDISFSNGNIILSGGYVNGDKLKSFDCKRLEDFSRSVAKSSGYLPILIKARFFEINDNQVWSACGRPIFISAVAVDVSGWLMSNRHTFDTDRESLDIEISALEMVCGSRAQIRPGDSSSGSFFFGSARHKDRKQVPGNLKVEYFRKSENCRDTSFGLTQGYKAESKLIDRPQKDLEDFADWYQRYSKDLSLRDTAFLQSMIDLQNAIHQFNTGR